MAVRKRGDRFIIDFYPHGRKGKRIRLTLPEAVTEVEEARKIEEDLRRIYLKQRPEPKKDILLKDIVPYFLEWYEIHRTKRSYETMKWQIERHLLRHFGNYRLSELSEGHISAYKRIRLKEGVTNRTINRELDGLGAILRWAKKNGYEVANLTIEKLPYKRPLPTVLSPEEVFRFIKALEPFYRPFFLLLYTLGLRYSEARFLRWEDIDFKTGILKVRQKGGSEKILPLNELVVAGLKTLGPKASGYVFLNERTKRPISNVKGAIKRAQKRAGIKKKINCHIFRHSIATHMLMRDINLRIIQQYLGHRQLETTQIYTHVAIDQLKRASMEVIGDYTKSLKSKEISDFVTTGEFEESLEG